MSANPDQHNEKAAADVSARTRLARGEIDIEEAKRNIYSGYQKAQDSLSIITGTPKTVLPKLKHILEVLRCGAFAISQVNGPATHEDRMMSIKLFAQEVAPALREYAKELGLNDAFQVKPGVAARCQASGTRYRGRNCCRERSNRRPDVELSGPRRTRAG